MRLRHLAAISAAVVLAGLLSGTATADQTTLYVADPDHPCGDAGPGTPADPFCTIQEAANAVQPGQTVVIGPENAYDRYPGDIDITTSGTPDAPITFTTGKPWDDQGPVDEIDGTLTLSGVHDVTFRNLKFASDAVQNDYPPAVTVTDSADVTLDHISAVDAIAVQGTSTGVALTRSEADKGITIGAGVTATTVSDNVIQGAGSEVAVTGATDTHVVNNTIATRISDCGPSVLADGGATGTVIENNYVAGCDTADGVVSVAADSTDRSIVDYNDVRPAGSALYSWAGTAYPTAATLDAGTGQGAHDINVTITGNGMLEPPEGSALVDSGNAAAPGAPATDLYGNPRIDDPLVPDTGVGFVDIGAVERQDPISTTVTTSASMAPTGGVVTATVSATPGWGTVTGYTVDFGDGGDPVRSPTPVVQHTYTTVGDHRVTASAQDSYGYSSAPASTDVQSVAPAPLTVTTQVTPAGAKTVDVQANVTSSWNVTGITYDFGDGSPPRVVSAPEGIRHDYAAGGSYTVTTTVRDAGGNTATARQTYTTPGTDFVPFGPLRVLDTRHGIGTGGATGQVPAGDTVRLRLTGGGIPDGIAAVALNVTLTDTTGPGYVTVYPDGGTRPSVSTLNFVGGQTVANATIVPVSSDGYVSLYVHGNATDLIADVDGYFDHDPSAATFLPTTPHRLLDTRASGNTVPARGVLGLPVAGTDGVPATATAVALNVTAVTPTGPGYLSVYPDSATLPGTSSLNFIQGRTVANMVVVPIGADGKVAFYNGSEGPVDVLADVAGYFGAGAGDAYVPLTPYRAFDTRETAAVAPRTTVQEGTARAGTAGFPDPDPAVVLNVTVTDTTSPGYLTVRPDLAPNPGTSNLNWTAGQTVPNMVIGDTGGSEVLDYYNGSDTKIDVLGDVLGYFAG